jgi:hypothetical protein
MAPERQVEQDFPPGHPGRADYNPNSAEAIEWARKNVSPLGERDFPVDHPKAIDTPGNLNSLTYAPGVDPHNPHREPFTGRTPEQVAGIARLTAMASAAAKESPVVQPLDAMVVANALNAKRKAVGRDILTPEEYAGVMADLQTQPRAGEDPDVTLQRINAQHQALAILLGKGYTRQTALEMIARDGADKVLADHPAE